MPFARCLYSERFLTTMFRGYSLVKLSGFMSSACTNLQCGSSSHEIVCCNIFWGTVLYKMLMGFGFILRLPSAFSPALNRLWEINYSYSTDISLRERFLLGHYFWTGSVWNKGLSLKTRKWRRGLMLFWFSQDPSRCLGWTRGLARPILTKTFPSVIH